MTLIEQNRKRAMTVALLIVVTLLLGFVAPKHADAATSSEIALGSLMNKARIAAGRTRLSLAADLTTYAHRWSANMAAKNRLYHNANLASWVKTSWSYLGENVGVGSSITTIQQAFMASAPHRANILDRHYRHVGIGVVSSGGKLWVTVIFRG